MTRGPGTHRATTLAGTALSATLLLCAGAFARPAPAGPGRFAGPTAPAKRPFAPDSIWNQPLPARTPLSARSATYVRELRSQVARAGSYLNTYAFSTPVYTVGANQRTVTVRLDDTNNPTGPELRQSWLKVPVPARARPAVGSDGHMVVWQPSSNTMWEFWKMHRKGGVWHAQWGGTIDDVSISPGYYTSPTRWGATATSLPLLGGLIRPSELAAGQIDHALAIAIPDARARYFAWPAQRTDGWVSSVSAIPEGQRFRLDPRLNLRKLALPPLVRMMAVAAQKYGIIVRDQSGSVSFYAEDTDAEGLPNPYYGAGGWFDSQYVNNLLKAFPWSHLEALSDSLSCCWYQQH
jgi:hypothetical protein